MEKLAPKERNARLISAVEIGVGCLERAATTRDTDFVRQQMEEQVRLVTAEVEEIPAQLELELRKQIGTKDGQVLAPLAALVGTTEKVVKEKLAAVAEMLDKEIDPRRGDSKLGRALGTIGALLDPRRDDSVQRSLQTAVESIAGYDGTIANVLKKALEAELKPLRDELDRLADALVAVAGRAGQDSRENGLSNVGASVLSLTVQKSAAAAIDEFDIPVSVQRVDGARHGFDPMQWAARELPRCTARWDKDKLGGQRRTYTPPAPAWYQNPSPPAWPLAVHAPARGARGRRSLQLRRTGQPHADVDFAKG